MFILFLGLLWYLVFPHHEKEILNFENVNRALGNLILEKDYLENDLRRVNLSSTMEECTNPEGFKSCPEMISCRDSLSKVSSCLENRFTNPEVVVGRVDSIVGGEKAVVELSYPASEGLLFRIDDVFVNHKGDIFDDKILYHHGGCKGKAKFNYKATAEIKSYLEGITLAHIWGFNYYHLMGETLPRIFQVRQFILDNPDVPLFVKIATPVKLIFRILRLENRAKVTFIDHQGVVHLNQTFVPLDVACGRSSNAVWREFRRFFFSRSIPEILEEIRPPIVKRLKIVVAERKGSRRIEGFNLLIENLQQRIQGEVVIFKGNEGLDDTLRIFSDATIFLGSHGAGLSNMAFMPDNGVVLELLPSNYTNHCFGQLATALELEYHMILGSGNKETPLMVDIDKVADKVVELASRFN